MSSFSDRSPTYALVTGGARRIGRAVCQALAAEGIEVTIHYRSSGDEAESLRRGIVEEGGTARTVQADLSDEQRVRMLIPDLVEDATVPDLLINNASVFDHTSFSEMGPDDWHLNLDVNLTAPVILMKAFADARADGIGGRIINLLDWRSTAPQPDQFAYSVSKSGLAAATRAAAKELAPEITVNGIAPGPILPPEGTDERDLDHIVEDLPAGRWGDPGDVVHAVKYLVHASTFVTGDILYVDGGRHLR